MPESSLVTSYKWLCGSVGTMLTLVVRGLRFKFVIVLVIAGYSTETEENGHCLKMIYFNKYKSNGTSISDLDGQVSEFGLEHRLISRSWRRRHFLFRQRTSGFLVSWRQPGNVCLVTTVHRVVAGRAVGIADPFFHVTCAKIIFLNLWPMLKIYLNGQFSEFYFKFFMPNACDHLWSLFGALVQIHRVQICASKLLYYVPDPTGGWKCQTDHVPDSRTKLNCLSEWVTVRTCICSVIKPFG